MHSEASPGGYGLPSLEQRPVVPVHAQLLALGSIEAACPAAGMQLAERVRSTDTMAIMGIVQDLPKADCANQLQSSIHS